jgi:hypothetical protein
MKAHLSRWRHCFENIIWLLLLRNNILCELNLMNVGTAAGTFANSMGCLNS